MADAKLSSPPVRLLRLPRSNGKRPPRVLLVRRRPSFADQTLVLLGNSQPPAL